MTMKQTQTKMFDFADVGLDFSAGSKSLFPDRFKKMLALGYNTQTVSSVTVAGNQVTLNYGMSHGYAADRVLKLNTPELADINNGEFVIDSVTTQTITLTIDNAPQSIAGNFTTKVAPLGWELMYEQANIHVYKMLHIDDAPRYVRLCFQNNVNYRNRIAVCIGKSYDSTTGFIDDAGALNATKDVMSPNVVGLPSFDGYASTANYNNYTYTQGYAEFGKGRVIGSRYHFVLLACHGAHLYDIWAIVPNYTFDYEALDYPLVIARSSSRAVSTSNDSTYGATYPGGEGYAFIGNIRVRFDITRSISNNIYATTNQSATRSTLPSNMDNFNTTSCQHFQIFEHTTSQFLGVSLGIYMAIYANDANAPTISKTNLPMSTSDIDLNSQIILSTSGNGQNKADAIYIAVPVEEIKLA